MTFTSKSIAKFVSKHHCYMTYGGKKVTYFNLRRFIKRYNMDYIKGTFVMCIDNGESLYNIVYYGDYIALVWLCGSAKDIYGTVLIGKKMSNNCYYFIGENGYHLAFYELSSFNVKGISDLFPIEKKSVYHNFESTDKIGDFEIECIKNAYEGVLAFDKLIKQYLTF